MRGPFELVADFYDYHFSYYRDYVRRRIIFKEYTYDDLVHALKFSPTRNVDYENFSRNLRSTTQSGLALGIIYGTLSVSSALIAKKPIRLFKILLPTTLGGKNKFKFKSLIKIE
jgi:hypothetical protein